MQHAAVSQYYRTRNFDWMSMAIGQVPLHCSHDALLADCELTSPEPSRAGISNNQSPSELVFSELTQAELVSPEPFRVDSLAALQSWDHQPEIPAFPDPILDCMPMCLLVAPQVCDKKRKEQVHAMAASVFGADRGSSVLPLSGGSSLDLDALSCPIFAAELAALHSGIAQFAQQPTSDGKRTAHPLMVLAPNINTTTTGAPRIGDDLPWAARGTGAPWAGVPSSISEQAGTHACPGVGCSAAGCIDAWGRHDPAATCIDAWRHRLSSGLACMHVCLKGCLRGVHEACRHILQQL
eukprot:1160015-Pelagomonas_calceolata.AAC.2